MSSISSVLLLSLLSTIDCFDWCPFIRQPNDNYTGLTIYNKLDKNHNIEHWINNHLSVEWRFTITADGVLTPDYSSIRDTNRDVGFDLMRHLVYKWNDSQWFNCQIVVPTTNHSVVDLICAVFDGIKHTNPPPIKGFATTDMMKQLIFIGPHLVMTTELVPSYLQLDRHDRQAKTAHFFTTSPPFHGNYICKDHRYPDPDICDNWFIDKLSDDLFKSLDSSLKYNDSEILWFNIDNRPKFCIQSNRRELSERVSLRNCQTM